MYRRLVITVIFTKIVSVSSTGGPNSGGNGFPGSIAQVTFKFTVGVPAPEIIIFDLLVGRVKDVLSGST